MTILIFPSSSYLSAAAEDLEFQNISFCSRLTLGTFIASLNLIKPVNKMKKRNEIYGFSLLFPRVLFLPSTFCIQQGLTTKKKMEFLYTPKIYFSFILSFAVFSVFFVCQINNQRWEEKILRGNSHL